MVAHLDLVNFRAISLGSKNGILANGAIDKGGADVTRELTGRDAPSILRSTTSSSHATATLATENAAQASMACGAKLLASASVTKWEVEQCPM